MQSDVRREERNHLKTTLYRKRAKPSFQRFGLTVIAPVPGGANFRVEAGEFLAHDPGVIPGAIIHNDNSVQMGNRQHTLRDARVWLPRYRMG